MRQVRPSRRGEQRSRCCRLRGRRRLLHLQRALRLLGDGVVLERHEDGPVVASVQLSARTSRPPRRGRISAPMRPLPVRPEESLADRRRRVIRARADERRRMTVGGLRWADLPPDVLRLVVKISAGHHPASRDAPTPTSTPRLAAAPSPSSPWSPPCAARGAMRCASTPPNSGASPTFPAISTHRSPRWRRRLRAAGAFARLVHLDLTDCPNASSDASLAAILAAAPEVRHVAVSDVGATSRSAARHRRRRRESSRLRPSRRTRRQIRRGGGRRASEVGPRRVHGRGVDACRKDTPRCPRRDRLSRGDASVHVGPVALAVFARRRGDFSVATTREVVPGSANPEPRRVRGTDGWIARPKVGGAGDPWNALGDPWNEPTTAADDVAKPSPPHLRELNLSAADRVPSAKGGSRAGRNELCTALLLRLTWNSSRLRALDVSGCEGVGVDDGEWSAGFEPRLGSSGGCVFSRAFESLEVLRAGDTAWASDRGLETILRFRGTTPRFPNLRALDLASSSAPNLRRADATRRMSATSRPGRLRVRRHRRGGGDVSRHARARVGG